MAHCDLCGEQKAEADVTRGTDVTICDECVETLHDIVAAKRAMRDFDANGGTSLDDLKKELGH